MRNLHPLLYNWKDYSFVLKFSKASNCLFLSITGFQDSLEFFRKIITFVSSIFVLFWVGWEVQQEVTASVYAEIIITFINFKSLSTSFKSSGLKTILHMITMCMMGFNPRIPV